MSAYKLDYTFRPDASGDQVLDFKITPSNVDGSFKMLVPLYLELDNGKMSMLGRAHVSGTTPMQARVPLKGMKIAPHRAVLNYYDDVLASPN